MSDMAAGFLWGVFSTIVVIGLILIIYTSGYDAGKKDKNVR
jgi:hypothetical protein